MRDSLLPIYRAVAEGRLTQAEALLRIKEVKRSANGGNAQGMLLATRQWKDAPALEPTAESRELGRILLIGFSQECTAYLRQNLRADELVEVAQSISAAIDDTFTDVALGCFDAIKALLTEKSSIATRMGLMLVVADSWSLPVSEGLESMLRTADEENPSLLARVVRVPTDIAPSLLLNIIRSESGSNGQEFSVRYRRNTITFGGTAFDRQVPYWDILKKTAPKDAPLSASIVFKEGGCYLITGGMGGIGLQFALEIVRQTSHARIVLAGRSESYLETRKIIHTIETPKHTIDYVSLDVTEQAAVDALVQQLKSEGQPLNGIIHCAGITRDSFIIKKSAAEFVSVLSPKVVGLGNLDRATHQTSLDFMLLCSSVAACWGIVGQIDYAAANGFMDAFAEYRNRLVANGERQGRTLSINWPFWQDGGMTLDSATRERMHERTGMQPLKSASAMRALYQGLSLSCDRLLVMEGELSKMQALLENESRESDIDDSGASVGLGVGSSASLSGGINRDGEDFKAKTLDYVSQQFSIVLKIPVARLRPEAPLEQYGMDSIIAMKLVTHLESIFGKLPKTLAFEYQTIAQLSEYFCTTHAERLGELLAPQSSTSVTADTARPAPVQQEVRSRANSMRGEQPPAASKRPTAASLPVIDSVRIAEPVAIIGLSGRYPDAWDIEEYWENLAQGKDCISEVPAQRWRWEDYYRNAGPGESLVAGEHASKWGGFIAGADEFDPRFFNITPRDAEQIDPQERLFLQHAWMAIEDAGYTRAALQALQNGKVGVYAGVMYGEYNRSGSLASIANRVSYVLNLHGPSMTLDTMCSSSLTAIHLACQDLRLGRTEMALAGGVNLSIHPGKYSMLSEGQFISSDGHCQSFGEGGNGYIPGEGVGIAVLKRLSDAERDGDAIYAIIRSSALNHGGKTNGYTVPNPQAQAAVIADALKEAGINARHVSYIEAHGTGTKLGDPIEIAAISKAFKQYTSDTKFCLIGSAKSNIGHCESAAGIAGLTKVLLQMRHRQIVPSLHSERLNPNIDFDETPFIVNQRLRAWDAPVVDGRPMPLIAGISSFGAGGSNAHVLVEAYTSEVDAMSLIDGAPCIVVLSARTFSQLQQKARDLKQFVENNDNIDIISLAYTSQIGREAMDERLAMLVHSPEELKQKLAVFIEDEQIEDGEIADDVFYAQSRRHRDAITLFSVDQELQASVDNWFRSGKFSRLIDIWTKGLDLDWRKLYGAGRPRRSRLPAYPFARETYWRQDQQSDARARSLPNDKTHHSLLHHNASKPGSQRYRSVFRAEDPRFGGVKLFAYPMVPRGLLIESARAAIDDALPTLEHGAAWELQELRFADPNAVSLTGAIDIAVMMPGQGERPALQKIAFEISTDDADRIVLCQGVAELKKEPVAPKLDIARLRARSTALYTDKVAIAYGCTSIGIDINPIYQAVDAIHRVDDGLLLSFELSEPSRSAFADCLLHPAALECAMVAAQWLHSVDDVLLLPIGIDRLRVYEACKQPSYAWIRPSDASGSGDELSLDISFCSVYGSVSADLETLRLSRAQYAASLDTNETTLSRRTVAHAQIVSAEKPYRDISDVTSNAQTEYRVFRGRKDASKAGYEGASSDLFGSASILDKPSTIALKTPDDLSISNPRIAPTKPAVVLMSSADVLDSKANASVVVRGIGDGVFSLQLQSLDGELNAELIDALKSALDYARELPSIKMLVIEGDERFFLRGSKVAIARDSTEALYRALVDFPYPTLALLSGKALDEGFSLASTCDFIVAIDNASFGFSLSQDAAMHERRSFVHLVSRFGESLASILTTNADLLSGKELQRAGWGARVVSREQLSQAVQDICKSVTDKPQRSLRLLKQHLVNEFDAHISDLETLSRYCPDTENNDLSVDVKPEHNNQIHFDDIEYRRTDDNRAHLLIKAGETTRSDAILHQLSIALHACRGADTVVLNSEFVGFLPDDEAMHSQLLRQVILELMQLRVPVIAALDKGAINAGFLLALACDFAVYSEESQYGGLELQDYRGNIALLDEVVTRRFGVWSNEWVLTGLRCSGRDLRLRMPSLVICASDAVGAQTQRLADRLPIAAQDGLFKYKKLLSARIQQRELTEIASADILLPESLPIVESVLALSSSVVHASVDADGIVLVRLQDREAKNMFSDALIAGLQEVFDHVRDAPSYKAVVLVGYDTYFASGGTHDGLKAIHEGKVRFTDLDVFQIAMRCSLPVIAAMQGHGIGAGWTLGLFADFTLFSEESRYVSPYMNLGFTPGAGATGILPLKLGLDLARESLYSGREMLGDELKQRNPLLTVVPRERVLADAIALARRCSRHSRSDLIAWKAAAATHRFAAWQSLFAREVQMHEATLVGQSDALVRIDQRFTPAHAALKPASATQQFVAQQPRVSMATRHGPPPTLLTEVLPTIRRLLAEELRIDETEIEARMPFVELGLDSISSVTWIRKINESFDLQVEATKVYSYPNLQKLAQHIGELLAVDSSPPVKTPQPIEGAVSSAPAPRPAAAVPTKASKLRTGRPHFELSALRRAIIVMLAQELRQEPDTIEADRGFVELGLDSISGVTWIRAVNQAYGTTIDATKIYAYPTIEKFARFLLDTLTLKNAGELDLLELENEGATSRAEQTDTVVKLNAARSLGWPALRSWRSNDIAVLPTASVTAPTSAVVRASEIAVIGMAGSFPMAKDLERFWDNIANGRNCVSEIPASRWDTGAYFVEGRPAIGQSNSKWMGVLEGHDQFDPLFFGLSPIEAESMDPQQRLLLQCCWHGMENAGYTAERLSGSKSGVFVGCAYSDYNLLSREQQINALGFTGGATSILAARVSYFLNLHGPCVSIDTACSSSLVAIATACDSLMTGATDLAFAAGVYVMANPDMFLKTAHAGMLSPDGRCYTFDQRANGFVPGEGVGVVVLKRLADAERDGDSILAVVRGWGVNQDGRTNGITAPNAESQQRLMLDVYDRFALDPSHIQLVEAHGTGTKLGDPIEIEGLKSAFGATTDRKNYCAIGSVKTNIGHCLTAAGVSGFIKLLLALKHRQLPPSINFEVPNEHLNLDNSPFFVNTRLREWTTPPGVSRHAAISSFGFSGTNAHLVLSEYTAGIAHPTATLALPDAGVVVPLSARTSQQLMRKALDLRDFIQANPDVALVELSHNLQMHRDAMDERLCFVAHGMQDVIDTLNAYIDSTTASKPLPANVFAAHVKHGLESVRLLSDDAEMAALVIDKCIADGNLGKLCELWVKGLALDWSKLYGAGRLPMIALPSYPFSGEAYWITPNAAAHDPAPTTRQQKLQHLHPLLQERVVDIRELGYQQEAMTEIDAVDRTKQIPLMHLPTYAFARMRCWIPAKDASQSTDNAAAAQLPSQHGRFAINLDSIAELFTELELDRLTTHEVVERMKSLA